MEPEVFCRWCGQKMSLVIHKDHDGYWGQYMCKCGASARWGNKHKKRDIAMLRAYVAARALPLPRHFWEKKGV